MLNHIQGIKITEKYKGIQNELELSNLGRINTICGKNNSGKSSLIELINNLSHKIRNMEPNLRIERYLFTYNDELIQLMVQHIKKRSKQRGYHSPSEYDELTDVFSTAKNVTYPFSYWYGTHFQNAFDRGLTRGFRDAALNCITQDMKIFFDQWLSNIEFKSRLIPAKRNLPINPPIKVASECKSDGEGLINHLFFLRTQDIGSETYKKYEELHKAFIEITNVRFNIVTERGNKLILKFSRQTDSGWLACQEWGQGLIDVLIILTFAITFDDDPILIEEPENHIHPEMQRILLDYLKNKTDKQYFFTTHSNIFLDPVLVDRIIYTEMNESVKVHDFMPKAEILKNLGYSINENICADIFLLVEGPTDIPVFRELLKKVGISEKFQISIFFLGGDTMKYFPLDDFLQIASPEKIFVITDKDPSSSRARNKVKQICEDKRVLFTKLNRYAIENYLCRDALIEFYKETEIPSTTMPKHQKISSWLGFDIDKKNVSKIFELMSDEEFKQTEDLYDFCTMIKSKLEAS